MVNKGYPQEVPMSGPYRSGDPTMYDIFRRDYESEQRKPRIDCPRHGRVLICAGCRKCLSCIEDDYVAKNSKSYLEYCREKRHTFLNLGAPCSWCRQQSKSKPSQYHSPEQSECEKCWEKAQKEYEERMIEKARDNLYSSSSDSSSCPSLSDDEYYYYDDED